MRNKNRPARLLARQLHIFCEGEKTEPNYLRHYLKLRGTNGTAQDTVVVIEDRKKNTPVQLVEEVIQKKKSFPSSHIFWVVCDRESKVKYLDALHHDARQKANAENINVALSNVCFEVWLLLHFQETASAYTSCDDLLKRSELKKHFSRYDKNDDFSSITERHIAKARKRAETMNKVTKKSANPEWTHPYQWNPYTNVYELLDEIDKILQENPR